MKAIIRKDEKAVSPVIATILMVAITVVLAAVLYVMVSGLITGPGSTPKAIGVSVTRSSDGTNWVILFTSVPSGLGVNTTALTLISGSGSTLFGPKNLGTIEVGTTNGVQYIPATAGATACAAGDRILAALGTGANQYTTGTQYQITNGGTILASGTFS
jgi:archaeal type IV pilus assembly protein PilA